MIAGGIMGEDGGAVAFKMFIKRIKDKNEEK